MRSTPAILVTPRKPHTCHYCGKECSPGEQCWGWSVPFGGGLSPCWSHVECNGPSASPSDAVYFTEEPRSADIEADFHAPSLRQLQTIAAIAIRFLSRNYDVRHPLAEARELSRAMRDDELISLRNEIERLPRQYVIAVERGIIR